MEDPYAIGIPSGQDDNVSGVKILIIIFNIELIQKIIMPDLIKKNAEEFSLQELDYVVKQIKEKYIKDCLLR